MHDMLSGRAVTGVLHFVNQTPIDWYSKKQPTVETATYGSEFVAARTAVDQIIDLRITLRYLGVPIREKSYLFGDNESVVKSSTVPHSTIRLRHHLLSFHRVREAIASDMLVFTHLSGALNPADILSKHWGYQQVWPLLRPILFWSGDTADISDERKGSEEIPSHQSECGTGLDGVTASQAGSDAITDGIATAKEWMAEGDLDEGMTRTSEIPIKTGVKNMDAPATEGVEKRGNTSYGESCSAP
jgi:hypothetical protein